MRAARREREACLEGRQLRQHFTVPKPSWGGQAGPLYLKITYTNLNKLGSFQSFTCKYVTTQETSIFPVSSIITGKQLAHRQVGLFRFFPLLPTFHHTCTPPRPHPAPTRPFQSCYFGQQRTQNKDRIPAESIRNSQDFSFLFSQNTSSKKLIHKILSKRGGGGSGVRKLVTRASEQAAGHRAVVHCTSCASQVFGSLHSRGSDRQATTTKGERQVADTKRKGIKTGPRGERSTSV